MPLFPRRLSALAFAAVLTVGVATSSARAGMSPALEINWWVDGEHAGTIMPDGTYNDGFGYWNYQGIATDLDTGVNLQFNINGDPDPLISGNLTVENPFLPSVDVRLQVILPVTESFPGGTELSGSAAVGLTTDSGGGTLQSLMNTPVWQGLIDGSPLPANDAKLFFDPFQLSNAGLGSASSADNFGIPTPISGPGNISTIGIDISFNITQFDQASITSVFNVVPAPGGGLLLLAGLAVRRRRRR